MNPVSSNWFTKDMHSGRLRFTTDIKQAVEQALVIF